MPATIQLGDDKVAIVGYVVIDRNHPDFFVQFAEGDLDEAKAYADMNGCPTPTPIVDFTVENLADVIDIVAYPEAMGEED